MVLKEFLLNAYSSLMGPLIELGGAAQRRFTFLFSNKIGAAESILRIDITKALLIAQDLTPQPLVILTDSRCALQALVRPRENVIVRASSTAIAILQDRGFQLALLWITSHVGVTGNEAANRLATEAHASLTSVTAPDHLRRDWWSVQEHVLYLAPHVQSQRPSCGTEGLSRAEATLFRLRGGCAFTDWEEKMRHCASPVVH